MKYEHIPRPEVEHHHHVRELIERQEKRTADRNYHKEKDKEREERESTIKEAKFIDVQNFYCEKCKEDFRSVVVKQVESDWSCSNQNIAFYKAKCKAGHWCIRYITDKFFDGYWIRSRAVARDRGNHYKDILQPHETGYSLLYGDKFNK